MDTKILISIITPYYKVREYTKKLAERLIPQLNNQIEWIVIDDGSGDDLSFLLSDYVKLLHLPKNSGGASVPRNKGLDIASGKYILFIDADDMVSKKYISTIINKINKEDFDYCYISWESPWEQVIIDKEPPSWNTCLWNCIYKRDLIGDIRFDPNLIVAEDTDFNKKVRKGKHTSIKEILYYYNNVPGSLMKCDGDQINNINAEKIKSKNIFYVSNFNSIGGVETYIHELVRKYKNYDITVIYKTGNIEQLKRIKKYAKLIRYQGQKIECEKAFFNYETDIISRVKAKEYIQIIHGMFKSQKVDVEVCPKITKRYCVSESAGKEYEEITGLKCEHARNPLMLTEEEKRPALFLISATRLTREKGKERMKVLADLLTAAGYNFLWFIFTNDMDAIDNPNVIYLPPSLNIRSYLASIKGRGYGVQISDSEGDSYFTRECEALGLPLLITPIPSFIEQGLIDGKNCHYIPFDMKNIDIDKIVNEIPEYEPYIKKDPWDKILAPGKSTYTYDPNEPIEIEYVYFKPKKNYYDPIIKQRIKKTDQPYIITREWATELSKKDLGMVVIYKDKKIQNKLLKFNKN